MKKTFKEFAARLIVFSVMGGIITGFCKVLNDLLPHWAILAIIIFLVVLLAIPPRYKYFLFIVHDGAEKDFIVVAKDRYDVPIQRVFGLFDDCRISSLSNIDKKQYKKV